MELLIICILSLALITEVGIILWVVIGVIAEHIGAIRSAATIPLDFCFFRWKLAKYKNFDEQTEKNQLVKEFRRYQQLPRRKQNRRTLNFFLQVLEDGSGIGGERK